MDNIKIFENDLPSEIDLSKEKVIGIDNEALGLVLGRDPLTLVQLGLESKQFYLIKLNRKTYEAPNLIKVLSNPSTEFIMHYARQDLLWLKYHLNAKPKNILHKLVQKVASTEKNMMGATAWYNIRPVNPQIHNDIDSYCTSNGKTYYPSILPERTYLTC